MPPVGFEPTISAGERPQNYALDRAVIWTGNYRGRMLFLHLIPFRYGTLGWTPTDQ